MIISGWRESVKPAAVKRTTGPVPGSWQRCGRLSSAGPIWRGARGTPPTSGRRSRARRKRPAPTSASRRCGKFPKDVYDQIDKLGRLRYEPAVPSLIEVWEYCPGHTAVVKAGHALGAIGTPEARAALRAGIDDHEYIAQVLAVRTMFTDEGDSRASAIRDAGRSTTWCPRTGAGSTCASPCAITTALLPPPGKRCGSRIPP